MTETTTPMTPVEPIEPGMEPRRRVRISARLVFGLLILALGVQLTLENLGITQSEAVMAWWPVLLIVYGAAKIMGWTARRSTFVGALWLFAGGWMLLHNLGYLRPGIGAVWPLLLVALGVRILLGRSLVYHVRIKGRASELREGDPMKCDVVMGSVVRRVTAQDFRRAELNAVMAGIEFDLRGARMAGETAEIEANTVMGGIEIFVPEGWRIVNEATSALGSVEDHTRPAAPGVSMPTLTIRGAALMGGIEIKH